MTFVFVLLFNIWSFLDDYINCLSNMINGDRLGHLINHGKNQIPAYFIFERNFLAHFCQSRFAFKFLAPIMISIIIISIHEQIDGYRYVTSMFALIIIARIAKNQALAKPQCGKMINLLSPKLFSSNQLWMF